MVDRVEETSQGSEKGIVETGYDRIAEAHL
jgi:hypothetical protein